MKCSRLHLRSHHRGLHTECQQRAKHIASLLLASPTKAACNRSPTPFFLIPNNALYSLLYTIFPIPVPHFSIPIVVNDSSPPQINTSPQSTPNSSSHVRRPHRRPRHEPHSLLRLPYSQDPRCIRTALHRARKQDQNMLRTLRPLPPQRRNRCRPMRQPQLPL